MEREFWNRHVELIGSRPTRRPPAWLAGCLLILCPPGCNRTPQGVHMNSMNRIWGAPVEGCRLSISVPEPRVGAGQPVNLTLVFRNDGATAVIFARISDWFDYDYAITYGAAPALLTPFGHETQQALRMGGAAAVLEVAPGREVSRTVEISRIFDLSQPGFYTIEAAKSVSTVDGRRVFRVISNRISIQAA
jgi:hypothetical protein